MKKGILVLMIGFLLIGANLYAAGDLIVEGNVGIGTTPVSTNQFRVLKTFTQPGVGDLGGVQGIRAYTAYNPSSVAWNRAVALFGMTNPIGTNWGTGYGGAHSSVTGSKFYNYVDVPGTGNSNLDAYGMYLSGVVVEGASATFGDIFGAKIIPTNIILNGTITATNIYGHYIANNAAGVTATSTYGFYLEKQTRGTNNYGLVLAGDGAGSDIVFGPTQNVRLYSKSDNKLYANDGINETQVSPHDPVTNEWIFYSKNVKTGKVVRVDMEKLVKAVERLTGEKFMVEAME